MAPPAKPPKPAFEDCDETSIQVQWYETFVLKLSINGQKSKEVNPNIQLVYNALYIQDPRTGLFLHSSIQRVP